MTGATCAKCSNDAVAMVNGVPVCADHLAELQREAAAREDRIYAEEAARLGIELPPRVLRDREFGPVCWLLLSPMLAHKAWRFVHVDRRAVDWGAPGGLRAVVALREPHGPDRAQPVERRRWRPSR